MNAQIDLFSAPFYNTIGLSGETLKTARKRAEGQESRVLEIFQKYNVPMTPFNVSLIYDKIYSPAPLTSIRRSITNLTKDGKLVKCEAKKTGAYGVDNHVWELKN